MSFHPRYLHRVRLRLRVLAARRVWWASSAWAPPTRRRSTQAGAPLRSRSVCLLTIGNPLFTHTNIRGSAVEPLSTLKTAIARLRRACAGSGDCHCSRSEDAQGEDRSGVVR